AADASVFDEAIREVGAAMRTMAVEQPETAALILIEHEIFAHQANGLDGVLLEFARAAGRHPISGQKGTPWSLWADLGQRGGFLGAQHTDLAAILLQWPIVYWNFRRPQWRTTFGEDLTPLSPGRPRGNPSRIRALAPVAAHSARSTPRAPPRAARSHRREMDRDRARCRPASPWHPTNRDRTSRAAARAR